MHLGVRTKKSDALASPFPLTSVPALRSHLCVALSSDTVKSETMIPSRAEYFKQPAGRLLWPGLAGNYDPAGRGKRLYAEPHIALQNIRRRLAMMCGGTLTTASRKEGGTAVTVSIPLPKPEE